MELQSDLDALAVGCTRVFPLEKVPFIIVDERGRELTITASRVQKHSDEKGTFADSYTLVVKA
jgi:hypothetical protein